MNYEYKFCFLTNEGFENFHRTYSVSPGGDPTLAALLIAKEIFARAKYALKKWRSDGEFISMSPLIEHDDDAPEWLCDFCVELDAILNKSWYEYWNA